MAIEDDSDLRDWAHKRCNLMFVTVSSCGDCYLKQHPEVKLNITPRKCDGCPYKIR